MLRLVFTNVTRSTYGSSSLRKSNIGSGNRLRVLLVGKCCGSCLEDFLSMKCSNHLESLGRGIRSLHLNIFKDAGTLPVTLTPYEPLNLGNIRNFAGTGDGSPNRVRWKRLASEIP